MHFKMHASIQVGIASSCKFAFVENDWVNFDLNPVILFEIDVEY